MCKSVLHKHTTQEFIACCLTRGLGIIIKISFTEKNPEKASVENVYEVIIFTLNIVWHIWYIVYVSYA